MNGNHIDYLLRIADTSLILGQRLSEECGHGPVIEEDIALTNIALDLIGQARLLLTHAGNLEGQGRDEDALAFRRPESAFRNPALVELPNRDFAHLVVRNLMVFTFQSLLWEGLRRSTDRELAAIAEKCAKETRYHLEHSSAWTIRLGDGTDESHRRMQAAVDALWPYAAEWFVLRFDDEVLADAGIGVPWSSFRMPWEERMLSVLGEATLVVPERTPFLTAGTSGVHTEHLGHLLAEMQFLQRAYPGATW
ncbi:MAG: 1,2-phenylacetyl-CoA epoxidase subunit PaaC [Burkholderiales bacterium]